MARASPSACSTQRSAGSSPGVVDKSRRATSAQSARRTPGSTARRWAPPRLRKHGSSSTSCADEGRRVGGRRGPADPRRRVREVTAVSVGSPLCRSIELRVLLAFDYDGHPRVVAPYCHGHDRKDAEVLRAIQVGGTSRSGGFGFGKLWLVSKMRNVRKANRRALRAERFELQPRRPRDPADPLPDLKRATEALSA